ncbi:PREDICTED: nuclear factor of activated T-cells, cytoplasmic 1-like isoform X2 [Poecilia mexicana]|uniref:nuclear factor of activated T-cells, cytoplasmic 1-like isoform X2 n=1 Tax=Poecilia mexicana TaxID=48701 RepID=UPI00072E43A3|nr:PREDICTED: nuclear factor of activated T-cells, cytoplasmic 1-like isoform X2 [Poecilia mexicana]
MRNLPSSSSSSSSSSSGRAALRQSAQGGAWQRGEIPAFISAGVSQCVTASRAARIPRPGPAAPGVESQESTACFLPEEFSWFWTLFWFGAEVVVLIRFGGPAAAGAAVWRIRTFTTEEMKSAEEDAFGFSPSVSLSLPLASQFLQSSPTISVSVAEPETFDPQDNPQSAGFYSAVRPDSGAALEGPRIEITAYGQLPEDEPQQGGVLAAQRVASIVTLPLPGADLYRDPSCLSPASSVSSRSGLSDASFESGFSYNYDNSPQNSPWQSPSVSPKGSTLALPEDGAATSPRINATDDGWTAPRGSRPGSPCGAKRKYSLNGFPSPPDASPRASPRVSLTEDSWLPNTNQYTNSAILAAINALSTDGMADLGDGVPIKARRTSLELSPTVSLKQEPKGAEPHQDESPASRTALKKEGYFLDVPQNLFSWTKPKQFLSPSLPALDWQLPSSSGAYSLQIHVQPKSHHRAHYETEGSRGAVKALAGGHPVVQLHGYMESEPLTLQLFIGTADDRLLRPHAFYQVHRITGKTVSTPSHEVLHNNTKVLEIPLLPENDMRAIIDCAGILKLRNSDIELRKGETDIGRKNTRVRMVFRVHVSQPGGRTVSLQVASNPIECSQRSAQELPLVDKQSLETSPAPGGGTMVLDGHNFQHDSKVLFVEKAQDGHHVWESEATVERDALRPNSLLVEIPPYRTQRLSAPVHVNFYVCNGKRKRSQLQRFSYVPTNVPTIKTEPHDDYSAALLCSQHASLHPKPYGTQVATPVTSDLRPCVVGGAYGRSPVSSPKLQDLSPFSRPPPPHASIIQEASHRPPSPADSPTPFPQSPAQPAGPPEAPEPAGRVSIKEEPQELDQMYLDDVNEVIRNDLSSDSAHSHV